MSLSGNHDIGFIQNENFDFFQIKKFEFERPVQNFSWGSNYDVIGDFGISWDFFTSYSISENIGKKVEKTIYIS